MSSLASAKSRLSSASCLTAAELVLLVLPDHVSFSSFIRSESRDQERIQAKLVRKALLMMLLMLAYSRK